MKFNKKNMDPCYFTNRRTVRQSALASLNIVATSGLLAASLLLSACATVATAPPGAAIESQKIAAAETSVASDAQNNPDLSRLAELFERRRKENFASDYPLGPGDVIEITVSGMDEIRNLTERVTGTGTISLPFVGVIEVNGLTDKGVREEIRRRLETNYMRNPQVNLFVKEFRSRQVAVIGAVHKPGLYSLSGAGDTILSMISQAGGMGSGAAERILFIPAEAVEADKAKEVASALPARLVRQDPSPLILKNVEPIVIELAIVNRGGSEIYLSMPARPGDVIMVPGGGEVLVQGWVQRPGSHKVSSGLTILGVVAAAGGPMFAGDTTAVKLIRTNKQGQKTVLTGNLDAIATGAEPDLPVREGDVIEVTGSGPKVIAYGIYRFFTTVMRVGASAHIPIGN
jgi:polysaccharide export outer membrane protein